MKIAQIRFGASTRKDEFYPDDRFILECQINDTLAAYKTARVFKVVEMDIKAAESDPDAQKWHPVHPFEHRATIIAGYPSDPPQGFPHTTTTILLNGEPRNINWRLFSANDPYSGPCWALA